MAVVQKREVKGYVSDGRLEQTASRNAALVLADEREVEHKNDEWAKGNKQDRTTLDTSRTRNWMEGFDT